VTTSTTEALYGVFRAGDVRVALPLDELREVIMCPPQFSPLPATNAALLGAVNLRHVVIPVLCLCRLAGYEPPPGGGAVIVIVAREGQVFGLRADEIEGVARVPAEGLQRTTIAGDGPALFTYTFERPEDRAVVALLDAAAIAERPGIPVVRDVGLRPPVTGSADSSRRTVLLLQCGTIRLCIDVGHVHSVIPQVTMKPSPLEGETCLGVVHLQRMAVPAVDPLRLLGLGRMEGSGERRGLVLAMPRGLVVLIVSDIADIASVPVGDVLPLPPVGMRKGGFLAGVLTTADGVQHLLLDGEALRADAELDTLGGLGMPLDPAAGAEPVVSIKDNPPDEGPDGRRVVASVRKFLTYSVGMEAATPLDQVTEILPYPPQLIGLEAPPVLGVFTHRGMSVPLLCLPTMLGLPEPVDPQAARVLLIATPAGELVGFVVPGLHAIENSIWEESAPKDAGDPATVLQRGPLVKIGADDQGRLLPNIDLIALVNAEMM
jgi:purine-binding chemotaxis protein CheW